MLKSRFSPRNLSRPCVSRGAGDCSPCAPRFHPPRHDARHPQRHGHRRTREADAVGDALDETPLRDEFAIRQIVNLPDRFRLLGRQQGRLDEIADVDAVHRRLAAADVTHFPLSQIVEQLRQHRAIARPVDEARPQHDHGELVFAVVTQHELLGFDLGLRVAVHVVLRQRLAFVGAVMMARGVDAEAAEVDEATQRHSTAGVEQAAQRLDVDGAIFLDRTPIADLGRAVQHDLDALQRLAHGGAVGQVAADKGDVLALQ